MSEIINFLEIDAKADKKLLIKKFEDETGITLSNAHDAMILIDLIAYYGNLVKIQVNDAAKLNLVEYSRAPILDFIGKNKKCERLEGEDDESYIKRILMAPEGYSVAGPEAAYIYFAKSAHPDIVDVQIDVPSDDASVIVNGTESILTENTAENDLFSTTIDYQTGEIDITLKENLPAGSIIKTTLPHPYKLIVYLLTKEDEVSEEVINAVIEKFKEVCPLADYVEVTSAEKQAFRINATVYLNKNADETTVKRLVNNALNEFINEFKNVLNKSLRKNKIRTIICKIDGVFDVKLTLPLSNLEAQKNINYVGEIGIINYERVDYE